MLSDEQKQNLLYDLFRAFDSMKKWKATNKSIIAFELDPEKEILKLHHQLTTDTYCVSPYTCFLIHDPVPREIFAPHIRDRIIHHFIYGQIIGIIEGIFLDNSYACRAGKWTHYGIHSIKKMMRAVSDNYTKEARISKNDISWYFMSIDKAILIDIVYQTLSEHTAQLKYPLQRFFNLIKDIITNDPTKQYYRIGEPESWRIFPKQKSLFASKPWTGLPLGNLTSQIFANMYLHQLDVFITKTLGIRRYGRYMDDFVLMHRDRLYLQNCIKQIEHFLEETLHLQLHPKKRYFQPIQHGVIFCWVNIRPHYITPCTRAIGRWKKKIHEQMGHPPNSYKEWESVRSIFNSYLGMMKHWSTYRLRNHMLSLLPVSRHNHIRYKHPFNKTTLKLKKAKRKFKQNLYIFYKLFWW